MINTFQSGAYTWFADVSNRTVCVSDGVQTVRFDADDVLSYVNKHHLAPMYWHKFYGTMDDSPNRCYLSVYNHGSSDATYDTCWRWVVSFSSTGQYVTGWPGFTVEQKGYPVAFLHSLGVLAAIALGQRV